MKFIHQFLLLLFFYFLITTNSMAQSAPIYFGAAQTFSVLAHETVTNTGPSIVSCNIGVCPGSSVTGFDLPVTIDGTIKYGQVYRQVGSLAEPAMASANTLYDSLSALSQPVATNLSTRILGGTDILSLNPGIYTFSSSALLTDSLILNDGGDPNAVFIFKMGSTLLTATYAKVKMSSGGSGRNVFWLVGSSATIETYVHFTGNIIAHTSITIKTGASTTGKLFALGAAVTMDDNQVEPASTNCSGVVFLKDSDGDGVADILDDYPTDAIKAYNNYSSAGEGDVIAFEDLWPSVGDFDMNDLVMTYKYNAITNAQNIVVKVVGNFSLLATGGSISNGFGVQFPVVPSQIINLTGGTLEAGQDKAVIILFVNDHAQTLFWNTVPGMQQSPPKNFTISFDLLNGPPLSEFNTAYNQFIFNYVGQSRREVHQPGDPPTSLADKTLFGTLDDNTDTNAGRYYLTKTGLPFALNIPGTTFNYPIEKTDITLAYKHFAAWAISGGLLYNDWYFNTAAGYRNNDLIYSK